MILQPVLIQIIPVLLAISIALGVTRLLVRQFGPPPSGGRFHTIDGLRGYLAFFVFLYHASVWYFFLRTGQWERPPSNLYAQLGSGSVDLFFMITALLFWSKLIDSRSRRISWLRLYVSRVLRLAPLYLVVVTFLILIVGCLTGFQQREPTRLLVSNIFQWVIFTVHRSPDINQVVDTRNIVAGVTWSLPFEWWFYLSLPVFGLLFAKVRPRFWVYLSLVAIATAIIWAARRSSEGLFVPFLGGILAAFLVRRKHFCALVSGRLGSIVCIVVLASVPILCPTAHSLRGMALLSIAFVIVACGNNLFGLLAWPASRMLGEITYSIYLLHGMIYFVVFRYIVGLTRASQFSLTMHWLVVFSCVPILIVFSYVTFRTIEAPAMSSVPAVTTWLQKKLGLEKDRA